ncbi:glycine betaine ABC transporter substrate-binding protein [Salinisphaera sp. Q1T1-3]|uniref:glycine betaine ABC transporter substrate-binding protein n=1 Tax=Salinisphaera sp. Q1T1-3 TaxID=2321229 RepID=UPI000E74920A|nr:glycine betaine ABC transporter substrate-binding protein [Salinisphaera sp. Q1T1-3]RJS92844.1 glycine betaine ABC transporter substrate-binding protein [Salinisphaera sp. Q1T1-3]
MSKSWRCILRGCLLALLLLGAASAQAAKTEITIYTDNYAADEALSRVARDLLETHYDVSVTLKQVSVGVAFMGTARNDNTLFLAAWLPKTHADYMKRVKDRVDTLGTLYNGARIGWVVPSYVPKAALSSIADLKKEAIAKKLDGRIQGISAGAGEMQLSHQAMTAYGLKHHLRLVTASGPAMTAALKRAIDRHEWIVVTGWSPHWMWERFDLRYLADPKHVLGGKEHVDIIANPSIKTDHPAIAAFFSRMQVPLPATNAMLADANKTSYDAAAKRFVAQHPDLVQSWLKAD